MTTGNHGVRWMRAARAAVLSTGTLALVAAGPATRSSDGDAAFDGLPEKVRQAQQLAATSGAMARVYTSGDLKLNRSQVAWTTTAGRKEKAAFLGVTATPADATLRDQLKLPHGVGLVVDSVEDGSPAAAAGIAPHDVITKVGDQWAIDSEQFGVVVRMHKPGEDVPITLFHQGDQRTATAKLVEREVFVSDVTFNLGTTVPDGGWSRTVGVPLVDVPAEVKQLDAGGDDDVVIVTGGRTLKIRSATGGGNRLAVIAADGHSVFDGPIGTPEQRKAVPADVLATLEKFKDQIDSVKGNGPGTRRTVRIVETGN